MNDNKKKYNKSFDVILHFGHIWVCTPKYINLVYISSPICHEHARSHNDDVIMTVMASQITSPMIVLLNRLFRHRSKKTSKLHVTGLWARNSPLTGEFPAQKDSNAENVSIWWRHHACHPTPLIQLIQHRRVLSATNTFISMTICLVYRGYMCIY